MSNSRYAPEFQLLIDGSPIPAALRASIASVTLQTGLEGADRLDLALANEHLRWLDHPLLALDRELTLKLGYAPDPLAQMFVGPIVAQAASFPGGGAPTMTITAQDRIQGMQQGNKTRWFAIPIPTVGNFPIPDVAVAGLVSLEHRLIPIYEPIGAALSILLGGVEAVAAIGDPDAMQRVIRKQTAESDYEFLQRIASENGWEMTIDHDGPLGGYQLRFFSALDHLTPDLTLRYGQSLIEFTPRISNVGQIMGVTARIWRPEIKIEFTITVAWNWDRQSLDLSISPGFGLLGSMGATPEAAGAAASQVGGAAAGQRAQARAQRQLSQPATSASFTLVDEPVTLTSAPRIILSRLIPRLNRRLTGSGSTIGDPRIRAGTVLRLEGLGQQFGGLYRVTSATHTLDGGGYRTSFEVRKEIWFGSIPLPDQGAVPIRVPA